MYSYFTLTGFELYILSENELDNGGLTTGWVETIGMLPPFIRSRTWWSTKNNK